MKLTGSEKQATEKWLFFWAVLGALVNFLVSIFSGSYKKQSLQQPPVKLHRYGIMAGSYLADGR